MNGQAESTVEPMLASAGLRGRWGAIRSFLGHFPFALHQLLFRLAIAGCLPPRRPPEGAGLGHDACALHR